MNKYRLKYTKGDEAKYISHLDFVRTIGRTFKRANLPMKYSQGFNPHIIMTIALPISVGVQSDSEFMDIELTEAIDTKELINRINENVPLGIKILEAKRVVEGDRPLSKVTTAKYLVHAIGSENNKIEDLLGFGEIEVEKKTKKGIANVNIRPDIINLKYCGKDNDYDVFEMHLNAGSVANLKPDTVILAMNKYLNYNASFYKVKRINMYFENNINIF